MDRKSIIVLVASFALLAGWYLVVPILWPPVPKPAVTHLVATQTNQLETPSQTNLPAPTPPTLSAGPTNLPAPLVHPEAPEQIEKIETADAVYAFTSYGGGLKTVELKKYLEDPAARSDKQKAQSALVTLNGQAQVPVLALRGLDLQGGEALAGNGAAKLTRSSPTSIHAEQVLSNGLWLIKDFTVGSNYLVMVRTRLENRLAQPVALPVHSWAAGTASSISWRDDPTMLGAFWHNGVKEEIVGPAYFDNKSFGGCVSGASNPKWVYDAGASNVFWTAVHNQFFTMALVPSTNQIAAKVLVYRIELPRAPFGAGKSLPPYGYEASLVYPASALAPGQALEREFTLYAGPKEYKTLSRLGHNLDLLMGYNGFFGWFSKALLLSMNAVHTVIPNYGIVIITITVLIKLIFWPLTQASTRSMKRMSALQPKMKEIQEKYKEDPTKMNRKLMEFMKENKVSPMGGCLPMLLQIPVFIGFYQMIRSAIELRGVHFLWAADLARPDTIFVIPGLDFIPFFGIPGSGLPINPLPLIMGVTMFYQARMTPPSPGMDPAQQKIMKYMPMMFMVFLYNFSAGLTLYWTVQNLLTIAQMKLTKTKDNPAAGGVAAPGTSLLKRKKQS